MRVEVSRNRPILGFKTENNVEMHILIMVTHFPFLPFLGLVKELDFSEFDVVNGMPLACYGSGWSPRVWDWTGLKELTSLSRCSGVQTDSFFTLRPFQWL